MRNMVRALVFVVLSAVMVLELGCGGSRTAGPSTAGEGGAGKPPHVSSGQFVVFESDRLDPGTSLTWGLWLYDTRLGQLVDLPGLNVPAGSYYWMYSSISRDGRYITFQSDRAGGEGNTDICLYDRDAGSLVPLPNLNSSAWDSGPSRVEDDRYIAFSSNRPGWRTATDIYLYDRRTATVMDLPGLNSSDPTKKEQWPSISSGANYITFCAYSRPDGPGGWDVFLYDRRNARLIDLPGVNSSRDEWHPTITADGRYIAFSGTTGPDGEGICLYDSRRSSFVRLPNLNTNTGETAPCISGDGRYIAFQANRPYYSAGTNVYVYDRKTARTTDWPGLNSTGFDGSASIN